MRLIKSAFSISDCSALMLGANVKKIRDLCDQLIQCKQQRLKLKADWLLVSKRKSRI